MSKTSETVFVGCKIPSGLVLQLRDPQHPSVVLDERTLEGSSSTIQPWVKPDGIGITEMDEKFWLSWSDWAKKSDLAPFVKGQVFAAYTREELLAEARDKAKLRTGMEGLDITGGDPRLGEARSAGLVR